METFIIVGSIIFSLFVGVASYIIHGLHKELMELDSEVAYWKNIAMAYKKKEMSTWKESGFVK